MKVFYYRRLLRIFNLYYLLLLIVIILSPFLPEVVLITSKPWVYVLYLQNFWLAWGEKIDEWLAPTWSLAVEEHFYILLPLLVIALNKRSLLWICGVAIGLAITLRSAMSIFGIQHGNGIAGFFTLCKMDDLFVGVLAALLLRDEHCVRIIENRKTKLYIFALIFGLMMPVITYLDLNKPTMPFTNTIGFSIYYCFYVSVIIIVVVHTRGFLASVMRSYVLCWLGVRAYSIYIFHMMALSAGVFIARKAGYSTSYQSRIIAIALVLAVAAIMWRYIEGPLIKMGHRLAYAPVTPGPLDSQTERNVHISARAGVDMDGCGVA
jgi:peptidoglycan/LPS O-acetylase OafA/YrhL